MTLLKYNPVSSNRAPNFQIRLPKPLVSRIDEYREYLKHKTGFYPSFSEVIRNLLSKALTDLGIPEEEEENEPEPNAPDSK